MRKLVFLLMAFVAFGGVVTASNTSINNVSVDDDGEVWISQEFRMEGFCSSEDPQNTDLYVDNLTVKEGGDGDVRSSADLRFNNVEGYLPYSKIEPYVSEFGPGYYFFDLKCVVEGKVEDSYSDMFTVKELSMELVQGSTSNIFRNTEHRITAILTSAPSNQKVSKDAVFKVWLDSPGPRQLDILEPTPYMQDESWVVDVKIPDITSDRVLKVKATHDGGSVTVSEEVKIKEKTHFSVAVQPRMLGTDRKATLGVDARHLGEELEVLKKYLTVKLDGERITEITSRGSDGDGNQVFSLQLPEKKPGRYSLDVELNKELNKGEVKADRALDVVYPVEVGGEFANYDQKPLDFELSFNKGGEEKHSIRGAGTYSSIVEPGLYRLVASFPDGRFGSELEVGSVDLRAQSDPVWKNPLRHARYTDLRSRLPGIQLGGLYAFSMSRSVGYGNVRVSLKYTTRDIDNPDDVEVYSCDEWNFDQGRCAGEWFELGNAEFDSASSTASFTVSNLDGAYAIGVKEDLVVKHSLTQEEYTPDGTVSFEGVVQDSSGEGVENATVEMEVDGADISREAVTNGEGAFEFSFPVPSEEGSYAIDVEASKRPYRDGEASLEFRVNRVPRLEVVVPEEVKAVTNSSKTVQVYLENTGYRDIQDLRLFTEDIPFLKKVEVDRRPIYTGDSREIELVLDIPADAEPRTHKAELVVAYEGRNASNIFGLTVERSAPAEGGGMENESSGGSNAITGRLTAISPDMSPKYLAILGILAQALLLGAFVVRKRMGSVQRENVSRTVSSIKSEIGERDHGGGGRFGGGDGMERDRVMRTISGIKNELRQHREAVEEGYSS